MTITLICLCIIAYLVGSIPIGKIVAWFKGIDIQKLGTGNIGASNTYLVLGKKAALFVLICDIGKAYLMMEIALNILQNGQPLLVGVCLLIGNLKSIFLRFTGGKGVATTLGIFMATEPVAAILIVTLWGIALFYIKYVMVLSLVGTLLVPLTYYYDEHDMLTTVCSFLICVLLLLKHRANIRFKSRNPQVKKV